jgi:hypothetical protein
MLKLRLSSNCQDIKMPLMTRDTIAQAKKKLQVSNLRSFKHTFSL